ncbi:RNA repair transcriptional activator RtcR family protein [Myxococcus sp. MxC21-1]|uniref:RNA repair transcriptional activator RtcR family protein n=1 Tax=Myxococcus sp. MxC21-1 TaxID=3041439 RepID=UPI00292CBF3C|nr:RNA repair transcriptional activator RtcR family protein [Myxococcus sp. MxC21-1]WNZ59556.1 RNA repair transcriptional activator RtcR family protein [Myxococcus sp. MxC21-1]
MTSHPRRTVVFGVLGTKLDAHHLGSDVRRSHWRPTVALCAQQHQKPPLRVDELVLLHRARSEELAAQVADEVRSVSSATQVTQRLLELDDTFDFEEVFPKLHAFAHGYDFRPDQADYYVHLTTGSHVIQISFFLLTYLRKIPARLVQTFHPLCQMGLCREDQSPGDPRGSHRVVSPDLSGFISIRDARNEGIASVENHLKGRINTRNATYNSLIALVAKVATRSADPILLEGPTGAGKSELAKRIAESKLSAHQLKGKSLRENCATFQDTTHAHSTLFGHVRGAFTGASGRRDGLLYAANEGVLFLDEVGELSPNVQAMLLKALDEKEFTPLGADRPVRSNFHLIAGTNRDLDEEVRQGRFRKDLLVRISTWRFRLSSLRDRPEDIEPNLDHELENSRRSVQLAPSARRAFLEFARSAEATWDGNFRDLAAAVRRMVTLSDDGKIDVDLLEPEFKRLKHSWQGQHANPDDEVLTRYLGLERSANLDRFDRMQLAAVLRVVEKSRTLAEAGRKLFDVSGPQRKQRNDGDRLAKYLQGFGLVWRDGQLLQCSPPSRKPRRT